MLSLFFVLSLTQALLFCLDQTLSPFPFVLAEIITERGNLIVKADQPSCLGMGRRVRRNGEHVIADHILLTGGQLGIVTQRIP